jgi:hypothetical protein
MDGFREGVVMKAKFRGGRALGRRPAGYGWGWGLALVLALGTLWAAPTAAQDVDWEGLSERFAFEASPGLMAAGAVQTAPSIACDTTLSGESWVVWEDRRLGDPDIFAARVTAEGVVRDSSGLPIALGPARQTTPRIAVGGGTFLTVWQTTDPEQSGWRIEGVRLSPEGNILDAAPLLITESEYPLLDLDVVFGIGSFMVVWSDTLGDGYATHGVRVSAADGQVLDEQSIVLSAESNQQTGSAIAFDGEKYLLAYSRLITWSGTADTLRGEIAGRYVSAEGVPSPETFKIEDVTSTSIFTNDDLPMMAFTGNRYLVAWPSRTVATSQTSARTIFGRTLTRDGTLSARVSITSTVRTREHRNIAANADGYQLVWMITSGQPPTFYGVHVDTTGAPTSTETTIVPLVGGSGVEDPGGCDILWNGMQFVFVAGLQYISVAGDDQDIRASWLSTAGVVESGPVLVSGAAPMQTPRALAYDGTRYLAVWDEQVVGGWQIRGAFVSTEGAIEGEPFAVLPETRPLPWDPAVVAGGGTFVITWTENQNLYALRLDPSGQALGTRLLVSSIATGRPALGWDGEKFALAWKYLQASDQGVLMGRLKLEGDGLALTEYTVTMPDSSISVRTTATLVMGTSSDPALVCTGEQALFMWTRKGLGVYGVWMADSSWSVPTPPLLLAAGNDPGVPRGVFDGTNCFIAWSDLPEVYAVRLRTDGIILDPGRIPLDVASLTEDRPAVATDGSNRLAVWRSSEGTRWDLKGGRYGADGQSVAGIEFFANEDLSARWPLAIKGPEGQMLLIYASYILGPTDGMLRLHGKVWQQQPPSIDIAIHQNPGVTSDVNIIASPSEDIPAGLLTVRANGAPIDMLLVDESYNLYAGWYQARATGVVTVVATVGDSAGNVTHAERSFTIGEITPGDGGFLAGPHGALVLTCPPQALEASSYVMILPDAERAAGSGTTGFLLSPPDLQLRRAATLTVQVPACPAELAESAPLPILERRSAQGWDAVPARWNASEGKLSAAITHLGMFQVRWVAAAELPDSRLALSLGPAPWRTELTIRYQLPESGPVQLLVFDAAGRVVATLVHGVQEGGREHTVLWNGSTAGGGRAGSGVYFAQLRCGGQTVTRRSIRVQ